MSDDKIGSIVPLTEDSKEARLVYALKNLNSTITERDQLRAEIARLQRNEDCVQRLIVWAAENGWNGVDNAKILDSFIVGMFDELRAELAAAKEQQIATLTELQSFREHTTALAGVNERLRKALEEIAELRLKHSRLRHIHAEAVTLLAGVVNSGDISTAAKMLVSSISNIEDAKQLLDARDRRMKLIGAAEWLEANNERLDTMNRADVEEVAAQLRREAEAK